MMMGGYGGRRKLKRTKIVLPVGHKIEVRSEDNGFEGSWYTATIDDTCIQGWCVKYEVKYDHLLAEDEFDNLVGHVRVPILDEDNTGESDDCSDDCGWVRPLPPPLQFGKWALYYGLCVEVHHQDGWWEGVIFDHADGSEERRIFFPELGDEMIVGIDALRISQEWDEVSGTWHHLGSWSFLELVEEFEQEQYLPVSVKQLWYDVREKEGFNRLQEWASSSRAIWEPLVLEAIFDNLRIIVQNLFGVESLPERREKLSGLPGVPLACKMLDVLSPNGQDAEGMSTGEAITRDLTSDGFDERPMGRGNVCSEVGSSALLSSLTSTSATSSLGKGFASSMSNTMRSEAGWLSAVPDCVPGPQYCPQAVAKYASFGNRKPGEDIVADTRKHLLYLKWTIEFKKNSVMRFRYISPDGQCYHSLRLLCQDLTKSESKILAPITSDEQTNSRTFNDTSLVYVKKLASNHDMQLSSQGGASSNYREMIIEPEYCPQAIEEWLEQALVQKGKKAKRAPMASRARRHLSALGWTFSYTTRRGHPELKYTAPGGERSFSSLRRACRYCSDKGYSRCVKKKNATKTTRGSESDYEKSPTVQKQMGRNVQGKEKGSPRTGSSLLVSRKRGVSLQKMRCRRRKGSQMKIKKQDGQVQPYLALRSSKRQRQVGDTNPSHCSPRSILSWLMDNNVLLPREKAFYQGRNNEHLMAGRVTRNGIKCNCCGKLYSAKSFAVHAGGDYQTPASSIFLEDGRSLLECQMQIIRKKMENFPDETMNGPHRNCSKDDNDHVCSVCHYGGELILCDQCPSSFHHSCLNMENIPDGEWFCPSCCCGICGQNKADEDDNHSADNNSLCCTQCERTYHIGCLNDREIRFSGYPKENWFCTKKCESVFLGLSDLLGKQISLDKDNLTWTLLKPRFSEYHKLDASELENFSEVHSKLSIALEVMHECFEPFVERRTGRYLIGDVIFGRRSSLRRLNFQGFYTAILEKGDEIITVATLRVYGDQVAEIPLIGTRFQFRQRGMCRVLLDVLEKELMELGVQRLVLPAVPSVLNTWTGSFGFSKMAESEKLRLANYTFLEFQETVMCCKPLTDVVSASPSKSSEGPPRFCSDASASNHSIDLGHSSDTDSDVLQLDSATNGGILQQGFTSYVSGNINSSNTQSSLCLVVRPDVENVAPETEIGLECCAEDCTIRKDQLNNYDSTIVNKRCRVFGVEDLKTYKRRRFHRSDTST